MAKRSLASMDVTNTVHGTAVAEVPQGGAMSAPMQSRLTAPVAVSRPTDGVRVPYVQFASPKSSKWAEFVQKNPGLADGDPLLIGVDGAAVKLPTLRFFLIHATEFQAEYGGDFVAVERAWHHDDPNAPKTSSQCVEACGLVFDATGKLVPARMSFRDAKAKAGQVAAAELMECTSPGWGQKSEAHRLAQTLQPPYRRFVVEVSLSRRTAKSSGRVYLAADAKCTPVTDARTLQALAVADNDPLTRELFAQVEDSYLKRCGEYGSKTVV